MSWVTRIIEPLTTEGLKQDKKIDVIKTRPLSGKRIHIYFNPITIQSPIIERLIFLYIDTGLIVLSPAQPPTQHQGHR